LYSIWELTPSVDKKHFSDKLLLANSVSGGFTGEVASILRDDKDLVQELATLILEEHFTDSMHDDLLAEVGLQYRLYKRKPRDPHFRHRILIAYEYSCAVCGFNVQLGNQSVALEAAHIQWHQAGGPDREENGLALCSLHHKLFDRGVFMVSSNRKLYVAESAHGSGGFDDWLMKFHDKEIRSPINPDYIPSPLYIKWQEREVFKGKARYVNL
jgi:putative restriction endonuclease